MSQISADTIKGVAAVNNITLGNTPIVSASANSLTIRGEGSAQTSVQQGLCKAWCTAAHHANGNIGGDTFNISSYEDTATARGRPTMTNPINNDYCVLQSTESTYPYVSYSVSTTVFELSSVNGTGSYADGICNGAVLGDLA